MKIREADKSDISSILDLYAQPSIDNGERLCLNEAQKIFGLMKSYPYYKIFVAELENQVVGTLTLLIVPNMGHSGSSSGIVESVAVAPDRHRSGIGKKLMSFVLDECERLGCYKLTLSANLKREQAHGFYESLGFKKHGYSFVVKVTS
ncbi:GNAT family N-acetyltransferase [Reinekea marinisedimentorum]|uniref:GNAT family N-acetyltransferase n=1 Tax=Reinekea marinisedimentorum TaxID=230495 RepID=UPI001050C890|nr:GNAT family N-acetyltransferase [Reinekea marinisedimentorum]